MDPPCGLSICSLLVSLAWLWHGPSSLEAEVLREQARGRPERNGRLIYCHVKQQLWRIL